MVKYRGYNTSEKLLTFEEFKSLNKDASSLKFICSHNNKHIAIHFLDQDKIGKATLELILNDYKRENITNVIFISSTKVSSACQSLIHSGIEIFKEEEMLYNITKHSLVPKHRILTKEEGSKVMDNYRLTVSQMPKILKRDPVCRFLGAESGDIVEITRVSRHSRGVGML
ncbi:DNA-directed RNA polymerases I, II, and III subunit RPABC1 [Nosema bombycis CQ1]|uniref:DNA-directed RNA polymerases I, II, and III subunit RPABC1 n=1 Tax=Nosema bombycis (strain CQ1 / CVCC 102059) TaxID=578461 RepID=R0M334_NOSB1|nr:DNA-directed RNA polymerases I, II, and III subunit RPABC1 [Nosema bombycis CQ1]|eukprot:EOB12409.1 DNA-directed RNA polymerases I, II, and III subunit RPABC1 [Nosema bombycis CQ1]